MRLFAFFAFVILLPLFVLAQDARKIVRTEVEYANGNVFLYADLVLPEGKGPFPAVVFIHGSGASDRSNLWTAAYAKGLSERGIAILYPDKRGSGKSTGSWSTASIEDFAADAVAGVEFLQKDPRIDKTRIGVMGFSQGGDVVPLAARSAGVAFAIDLSGSVVPMFEQIEDEVVLASERAGLTASQTETIKGINRKGLNYAATGQGIAEYEAALKAASNGELMGQAILTGFPTRPDDPRVLAVRAIGNFDPMPYWQKLTIPILFVFGGQDTQIRVDKSIRRIDEMLSTNKRNYVLIHFNGNGHAIYRDDLTEFLVQWIKAKGAA